ncbi:MarR family winged helix-turn-helix transcriptional regulator [Desulfosporosinus fructosivorans]
MSYDNLKIDNQICFALYACSKEMIKQYQPLLAPLGITYTQYIVLLVLWERDNITVKELGEPLHLDSGTLTPLLKKLEVQGLVERIRSTGDERNVYIKLTKRGIDLKEEARKIPEKMFCSTGMSLDEANSIHKQLKSLLEKLM